MYPRKESRLHPERGFLSFVNNESSHCRREGIFYTKTCIIFSEQLSSTKLKLNCRCHSGETFVVMIHDRTTQHHNTSWIKANTMDSHDRGPVWHGMNAGRSNATDDTALRSTDKLKQVRTSSLTTTSLTHGVAENLVSFPSFPCSRVPAIIVMAGRGSR